MLASKGLAGSGALHLSLANGPLLLWHLAGHLVTIQREPAVKDLYLTVT